MTLPLAGIRILDLSNVLAGPFCGYHLARLGAEVIKVENPKGGDLARRLGADPAMANGLMGLSFVAVNADKQSVAIDFKPDSEYGGGGRCTVQTHSRGHQFCARHVGPELGHSAVDD